MWLRWLCLVTLLPLNSAYKPVVLIHGFFGTGSDFHILEDVIKTYHPGTNVTSLNIFTRLGSMNHLWLQIEELKVQVERIARSSPNGIHLLGYSQGGVIARGIIETLENHNVDTFISLASPQMGMYGVNVTKGLPLIVYNAHMLFYSPLGQMFSFAGYWRDPYHLEDYRRDNKFLPYINNEVYHTNSHAYKNNFLKLNRLALIGSPNDGSFLPWESSLFGYYREKTKIVDDMRLQWVYQYDSFGLRTMDERSVVHVVVVPNCRHQEFIVNKNVMLNYILPFLT